MCIFQTMIQKSLFMIQTQRDQICSVQLRFFPIILLTLQNYLRKSQTQFVNLIQYYFRLYQKKAFQKLQLDFTLRLALESAIINLLLLIVFTMMAQVFPQQKHLTLELVSGNALFEQSQETMANIFKDTTESQKIRNVLSEQNWHIKLGDYQKYNWRTTFRQMKQSSVQRIFAYGNVNPMIIQEIHNVNFLNLIHLDLGQNHINNIESLTEINFQKLQHLSLGSNHIFKVKSLNKLVLKFLDFMDLENNPLSQIDFVNILFRKTKKNDLYLFIGNQKRQPAYQLQDLSVMVKLGEVQITNPHNTKHIGKYLLINEVLNECQRISQYKVQEMLKSKFIQQAVHYMRYRA